MRLVFMGSPEFAVPSLRRLVSSTEVVGVVTQPDRPAGRGRASRPPAVKSVAAEAGLPIIQPETLRLPVVFDQLKAWSPDLIIVAAYGHILPPDVLDLPPRGCLNVHASLLPRWRGAAPVQAAILHGDGETGVTIMKMDPGLDTGAILSQRAIPILPDDTGGSLSRRLADLGADLLSTTIPAYLDGRLVPRPQDGTLATHAPLLTKAAGALDLRRPAVELARQVRAFEPWPGSHLTWNDRRLTVRQARAADDRIGDIGIVMWIDGLLAVATGSGCLILETVQPAGRKAMTGVEYARGAAGFVGARLTVTHGTNAGRMDPTGHKS
jgi:methionyl-tRNA formyltransferase